MKAFSSSSKCWPVLAMLFVATCLYCKLFVFCDSSEKYDSVIFDESKAEDKVGFEAIKELHRQMDDDLSGSVDINESIDFAREELQIEERDRLVRRQKAFHNNDEQISVDDLWFRWLKSEVRLWSTDQMIYWLVHYVEMPQYSQTFADHKVNGSAMPRLASPDGAFMKELHISNAVHRHKLQLKAQDLVLFGFRQHSSSYAKDAILVLLLAVAFVGYWFALYQRRTAHHKLSVLSSHLDRLKDMEQDFAELQKKMEQAHDGAESEHGVEHADTKEELAERRLRLQEMEKALDGRIPALQKLLIKTYEIEVAKLNKEKMENLKEMHEAREWVEKLRKKHSSLMSQIRSVHGTDGEQLDNRVLLLKQKMERTARSLEEHHQRWAQIENVCGFPILSSNEGLSSVLPSTTAGAYVTVPPLIQVPSTHGAFSSRSSNIARKHSVKSASDVFSSSVVHPLPEKNHAWPVISRSEEMEDLVGLSNDGRVIFTCDGEPTPIAQPRRLRLMDIGKSVSAASNNSLSSKEESSETSASTKNRWIRRPDDQSEFKMNSLAIISLLLCTALTYSILVQQLATKLARPAIQTLQMTAKQGVRTPAQMMGKKEMIKPELKEKIAAHLIGEGLVNMLKGS